MDAGVVFDVRAFCPQLKDTSRDALKDVDEVTLVNLDTGREATHELGEQLPRLERLRFRQSKLCSFRDLGYLLNLKLHAAGRQSDFDGDDYPRWRASSPSTTSRTAALAFRRT